MTLREDLYSINENTETIDFDVNKISEKFRGLDVAQILIQTEYKGEVLMIGIEKDWKTYGDRVGVVKLKIGDKSGLYHLVAEVHSFTLLDDDDDFHRITSIPLRFTVAGIDRLIRSAEDERNRIYHIERIRRNEDNKKNN